MNTVPAHRASAELEQLIDQAASSHRPVHIAGERARAVLVSADDWQAIEETLHLLAVPGMRESIVAGRAEALAQSATQLDW